MFLDCVVYIVVMLRFDNIVLNDVLIETRPMIMAQHITNVTD